MIKSEMPLVTFALIAYNQERYIREAVESAFSQTYEPLEIILSDDCSDDSTFNVMKEMADAYRGPHRIRLNRNRRNMGTAPHFFYVAGISEGEYFVGAAGDDVSKPERTKVLLDSIRKPGVWAVCSGYDVIDENGEIAQRNCLPPESHIMKTFFNAPISRKFKVIQGSTCAYAKHIFDDSLNDLPRIYAEDNLMNFLIYAKGGAVEHIPESLVYYRQHDAAIAHNSNKSTDAREFEAGSRERCIEGLKRISAYRTIGNKFSNDKKIINWDAIDKEYRWQKVIVDWADKGFLGRCGMLVRETLFYRAALAKWMVARLFGRYPAYFPKVMLSGKWGDK